MNLRSEWSTPVSSASYFTKEETVNDVKENFNIRRQFSAEGCSVVINNSTENVIIQDHSNPINADKADKKMLVPMEFDIKSGDYVSYRNEEWMVVSRINIVDDAYKSCQIYLCNWTLKFQSKDGDILSYPCITSNKTFSENANQTVISLGENKKSILLPFDENTSLLSVGKRMYVDKRAKPTPYKIIGDIDTTTYNYGDKGLICFIMEQDIIENNSQYPDRPDLGVCDYFEPTTITPEGEGYSIISCSNANYQITIGSSYGCTLTPKFYKDGVEIINVASKWSYAFPLGYENQFTITPIASTNKIKILVKDNMNLIGKTATFTVGDDLGNYKSNIILTVVSGF